ncbi:MAG: hypothetical protein LBF40_05810 [Deltaproteobacteria bacterium]|jgi:hypothetical protein|nr:hypothetical protein [Deltaproteobacteria bacterium]
MPKKKQDGRLVVFPEICPLDSAPKGLAHYLSWPSWEFFIRPPDNAANAGIDQLFSGLRDPKGSKALLIDDPPNFLNSLVTLRHAHTPQDMRAGSGGLPFDTGSEGDLKRQIAAGKADKPPSPDKGYLILALFTLGELEEREINLLCLKALKNNQEMLSSLIGPVDDPSDGGNGSGAPSEGLGLPGAAEGHAGILGHPARVLPERLAKSILRTWLRLAAKVLSPGDRLWSCREEFQELLGRSYTKVPGQDGQYVYHEHNI